MDFLDKLRRGYYYAPKLNDPKRPIKQCYSTPFSNILIEKLEEAEIKCRNNKSYPVKELDALHNTIRLAKKKTPDIKYLVGLVSAFNPDDEIFSETYYF